MVNDILLNEEGDLSFENGDFVIGESKYQDVLQTLQTPPGTLRSDGYFGINIVDTVNEDSMSMFKRELRKQLSADSKNMTNFSIQDGKLNIDAENL